MTDEEGITKIEPTRPLTGEIQTHDPDHGRLQSPPQPHLRIEPTRPASPSESIQSEKAYAIRDCIAGIDDVRSAAQEAVEAGVLSSDEGEELANQAIQDARECINERAR